MNDADLVALIQDSAPAKSNRGFQLAMQLYGGAMLSTARAITPNHADDAVQDAWISVNRAIANFEARASLKTWLLRITMNCAYNQLRKHKQHISLDELGDSTSSELFNSDGHWQVPVSPWTDDSPEKLLEARAMKDCIEHHMADLPQAQRVALQLTDFQAMDVSAVCELLTITQNHYRVLLYRARLSLFRMLDHFEQTGDC
ncbi:MAG: sigma-70 family RNA polymerase sigma factor [Paraperlucidibaca sp.]